MCAHVIKVIKLSYTCMHIVTHKTRKHKCKLQEFTRTSVSGSDMPASESIRKSNWPPFCLAYVVWCDLQRHENRMYLTYSDVLR